jgi:hypothetical protein
LIAFESVAPRQSSRLAEKKSRVTAKVEYQPHTNHEGANLGPVEEKARLLHIASAMDFADKMLRTDSM